MPNHDTPQKIVEAWLDFHAGNLCQSMDAVFVFSRQGMEIWCLSEENKAYRRLLQILQPLRSLYRIEVYATQPPKRDGSEDEPEPPPSLCENYELRAYLRDPFIRRRDHLDASELDEEMAPPDEFLKQRLLAFAQQVLERNRRIKGYAMDLPELASMALDPDRKSEATHKARAVCRAHAENLVKDARRLRRDLRYALPKARPGNERLKTEKPFLTGQLPSMIAVDISTAAQDLAERVRRFIYPRQHTVALSDLRQPGLLDALSELEEMVRHFQKAWGHASGGKG